MLTSWPCPSVTNSGASLYVQEWTRILTL